MKPLNKGHFGTSHFVLYRNSAEVKSACMTVSISGPGKGPILRGILNLVYIYTISFPVLAWNNPVLSL